ncbi:transcription elongation factor A N-terminal and central domain-containing protein 2-like [Haliotis rubra]|uniref:transcription elongation factor A N-terminal and central domain-containing protein 2-like n=1 Tax=Haliotis rubra TaxID=36100 RepID=UPI001EE610BC|nr:transcription elongation factor A N-terminal and central domain-containing protein 2-like [Haliotis rubra]
MDKFVTRTRKQWVKSSQGKTKQFRQATIESLQGVVVIEDIQRLKNKLKLENQAKDVLVDCLKELGKKIPPRHVMLSTKIGKVVNRFRKHEDNQVASEARQVYLKWRRHFKDHLDRPQIEVKCDAKTEKMRASGKRFIADALSLQLSHSLPEAIEREVFFVSKRLINVHYRRTMRTVVFTLRNKEDVKNKVIAREMSVEEFVKTYQK